MKHTVRLAIPLFLALVLAVVVPGAEGQERFRPGYLGVSIQDVTERLMKEKDLKSQDGAYISEVTEDSPADSAGLKKGDIVTEFAGRTIFDSDDLSKVVSRTKPGTKTTATILREGQKKSLAVTVGRTPRRRGFSYFFNNNSPGLSVSGPGRQMFGLSLLELNDQLGAYFEAPDNRGVLVEHVEKDGAGDKAGIKAGDVLTKIGSRTIDDVEDVSRALEKYDDGDKVVVDLIRKGAKKTVTVEVEEADEGPWGVVAPSVRRPPRMELFRGPEGFGPGQLEISIPRLEGLERRIQMSVPKMEFDGKRLEEQLRQAMVRIHRIPQI